MDSSAMDSSARPPGVFVHPPGLCESDWVGAGDADLGVRACAAGAVGGRDCNICDGAFIESGAVVGHRVTVKNQVIVFEGVTSRTMCCSGPGVIFTNDMKPRAHVKDCDACCPTLVRSGATLGARAVMVCGITIGRARPCRGGRGGDPRCSGARPGGREPGHGSSGGSASAGGASRPISPAPTAGDATSKNPPAVCVRSAPSTRRQPTAAVRAHDVGGTVYITLRDTPGGQAEAAPRPVQNGRSRRTDRSRAGHWSACSPTSRPSRSPRSCRSTSPSWSASARSPSASSTACTRASAPFVRISGGWLADRTDRPKWVAFAGYGVSAVSRVGLLLRRADSGRSPPWSPPTGSARGCAPAPRDALIARPRRPGHSGPELRRPSRDGHRRRADRPADRVRVAGMFPIGLAGYDPVFVVSFAFAPSSAWRCSCCSFPTCAPGRDRREASAVRPRWSRPRPTGRCAGCWSRPGLLGLATVGDGFLYLALQERERLRRDAVPAAVRRAPTSPTWRWPSRSAVWPTGSAGRGSSSAATRAAARVTYGSPARESAGIAGVRRGPGPARRLLRRHRRRARRARQPPGARGRRGRAASAPRRPWSRSPASSPSVGFGLALAVRRHAGRAARDGRGADRGDRRSRRSCCCVARPVTATPSPGGVRRDRAGRDRLSCSWSSCVLAVARGRSTYVVVARASADAPDVAAPRRRPAADLDAVLRCRTASSSAPPRSGDELRAAQRGAARRPGGRAGGPRPGLRAGVRDRDRRRLHHGRARHRDHATASRMLDDRDWRRSAAPTSPGLPSRARMSDDGALISTTTFVVRRTPTPSPPSPRETIIRRDDGRDRRQHRGVRASIVGRRAPRRRPTGTSGASPSSTRTPSTPPPPPSGGKTWLVQGSLADRDS